MTFNIRKHHFLGILLFFLLCFTFSGCSGKVAPEKNDKLQIVTSIFPIADIIKNVGGNEVDVKQLVQPGQSPHTYEPLPKDMIAVSKADIFAVVGLGLEFWSDKMLGNVQNDRLIKIVYADHIAPLKEQEEHISDHEESEHHHGMYDPHIWLSPKNAIIIAEVTRDALVEAKPSKKDYFINRCKTYVNSLNELDRWVMSETQLFSHKEFIAFHPAWGYLAKDYGLKQIAAIEESPGKEITPEKLSSLIKQIKSHNLNAIFSEPQFNPKTVEILASEANIKVLVLDPIGSPESSDRNNYINLIKTNVEVMRKALQ